MQKSPKNELIKTGVLHFLLAILIGLVLFLVSKSIEAGALLGTVYWIGSWYLMLRKWHSLQFESNANKEQSKIRVRRTEMAGMIMLGLVLGLLTYLFSHWVLAAFLVTFFCVAGAFALHKVSRNKGTRA